MALKAHSVRIPRPHPAQFEILNDDTRFQVALCGRRFGKTELAVDKILFRQAVRPGIYWWVGLSWQSASMIRAWRLLRERTRSIWSRPALETKHIIHLLNGTQIWLRSADNDASLAGEGVMGAVVDEFTLMRQRVWTEYLRGCLSDYQGWALFTGVPKGMNWGADLYFKGQRREPGWKSWQLPTSFNPFILQSEINDARRDLPERVFQQEYEAIILQDGGSIFRNLDACATARVQEKATPYHVYVISCDWAKQHDFSFLIVIDCTTREVCHVQRSNKVDYVIQTGRLQALCELFNPVEVVSEVTGNQALNDFLRVTEYSNPDAALDRMQRYVEDPSELSAEEYARQF
ncbi:MAG TPA: hypothetical protein VEZ90_01165, partial [Blastocatellia bacterium]|nr:hypothetical protein [Blastocatellia bacterium]